MLQALRGIGATCQSSEGDVRSRPMSQWSREGELGASGPASEPSTTCLALSEPRAGEGGACFSGQHATGCAAQALNALRLSVFCGTPPCIPPTAGRRQTYTGGARRRCESLKGGRAKLLPTWRLGHPALQLASRVASLHIPAKCRWRPLDYLAAWGRQNPYVALSSLLV